MKKFVDREKELKFLEKEYRKDESSLVVGGISRAKLILLQLIARVAI